LVKFFITGRPELPIRTEFRLPLLKPHTEVFHLHEVDRGSVDQDIELYLKAGLLKIAAERSDLDLTVPWPEDQDIKVTIKKCSGLFIVASVIIKLISSPDEDPKDQLKMITSNPDSTVHEGQAGIDGTYDNILVQASKAIGVDKTLFYDNFRLVVGSIVIVFNPLSCKTLAAILNMKVENVRTALRRLHSVIIVPYSDSKPIRICHKSVADYLQDKTRCTDPRFHIDASVLHLELGLRCLRLMNKSLKRNICQLSRYDMNADIRDPDLDSRREKYIGDGLEYADHGPSIFGLLRRMVTMLATLSSC
jgi:hypothetical protein